MKHICPYCEVGELSTVPYTETVKAGRRTVEVAGLLKLVCAHCGEESVPVEMYDRNTKVVEGALAATPAAVSRGLLRRLRETWGVSQRDASRLFGAGASAFAKWESGQARMSEPAALLVQCALNVPGVMTYLATLAHLDIRLGTHLHKAKVGVDYNWAFLKDVDVPEKKVSKLTLVGTSSHMTRLPPRREHPWEKEYSRSLDELKAVA